jgi:hypothetical protein
MSEWQDISSAPKDGTIIDLWDADWKCRLTDCAWKHHHWNNGIPQGQKDWRPADRDGPPYSRLTHWMPLPPEPKE